MIAGSETTLSNHVLKWIISTEQSPDFYSNLFLSTSLLLASNVYAVYQVTCLAVDGFSLAVYHHNKLIGGNKNTCLLMCERDSY